MAGSKNFKVGIIIEGDSKGGVKAIQATEKELVKLDNTNKKTTDSFKGMENALFSMKGVLAGGGIAAFAGSLKTVIDNTIKQENAIKQLESRLKSTKGAVGITSSELQNFAASLQNVTTYGDETILAMQSILLTFTNIKGDVFEDTTEAVLNLSTVMGTDLKSSAVQLGKALNAPTQNLSALTRSGIQFTDAQKDQIEELEKAGKLYEAQKIILAELQTQFGGAAVAARDTLGGAFKSLGNAWGDLLENTDQTNELTASINELTDILSSDETQQAFNSFTTGVFKIVSGFASALTTGNQIIEMLQDVTNEAINNTGNLANAQKILDAFERLQALEKGVLSIETELAEKRQVFLDNVDNGVKNTRDFAVEIEGLKTSLILNKKALEQVKGEYESLVKSGDKLGDTKKRLTDTTFDFNFNLNNLGGTVSNVTDELDDMDRALDLIDAQFKKLDQDEAISIAGLEKIPTVLKETEKQNKDTTESIESDWEKLNENIQAEFIDSFADMLTGAEDSFEDFADSILKMWLNTTMNMAFDPTSGSSLLGMAGSESSVLSAIPGLSTLSTGISTAIDYGVTSALGSLGATTTYAMAGAGTAQASMLASQTAAFGFEGTALTAEALTGSSMLGTIGAAAPYLLAGLAVLYAVGAFDDTNRPTNANLNYEASDAWWQQLEDSERGTTYGYTASGGFTGFSGEIGDFGHDDQMSTEEALQWTASMQAAVDSWVALDEMIISSVGLTDAEVSSIGDTLKSDINAAITMGVGGGDVDAQIEERYAQLADLVGGDFNAVYDQLTGSLEASIAVAADYAAQTDGMKAVYDYLITATGGASEDIIASMAVLSGQVDYYNTNILSGTEQANMAIDANRAVLESLGLTGIETEEQLKAYVDSLDENSEGYAELYLNAMAAAPAVVELSEANDYLAQETEKATQAELELAEARQSSLDSIKALLENVSDDAYLSQLVTDTQSYFTGVNTELSAAGYDFAFDTSSAEAFKASLDEATLSAIALGDSGAATAEELAYADTVLTYGWDAYNDYIAKTEDATDAVESFADAVDDYRPAHLDDEWEDANALRDEYLRDETENLVDSIRYWAELVYEHGELTLQEFNDIVDISLTEALGLDTTMSDFQDTLILYKIAIEKGLATQEDLNAALLDIFNPMTDTQQTVKDFNDTLELFTEMGASALQINEALLDIFNPLTDTQQTLYDFIDTMQLFTAMGASSDQLWAAMNGVIDLMTEQERLQYDYDQTWMLYTSLLKQGVISQDKYNEVMEEAADTLNADLLTQIDDLTAEMESATDAFASLADTIDDAILTVLRDVDGWSEVDYQQAMINSLNIDLASASGSDAISIIDDLTSHTLSLYDAKEQVILDEMALVEEAAQAEYDAQVELYNEQMEIYDSQLSALEDIKDYADSLMDTAGVLSNSQTLASATATYGQTLLSAQAYDVDALQSLPGAATDYLDAVLATSSTSTDYNRAVGEVQSALSLLDSSALSEPLSPGDQAIVDLSSYENELSELQNETLSQLYDLESLAAANEQIELDKLNLELDAINAQLGVETGVDVVTAIGEVKTSLDITNKAITGLVGENQRLNAVTVQQAKQIAKMSKIIQKQDVDGVPATRAA